MTLDPALSPAALAYADLRAALLVEQFGHPTPEFHNTPASAIAPDPFTVIRASAEYEMAHGSEPIAGVA